MTAVVKFEADDVKRMVAEGESEKESGEREEAREEAREEKEREEAKREKFRRLSLSEEDFRKLPPQEQLTKLEGLKDEVEAETSRLNEELSELETRKEKVLELIEKAEGDKEAIERTIAEVIALTENLEVWKKEIRKHKARVGALTRWLKRLLSQTECKRMEYYRKRMEDERERAEELRTELARLREEIREEVKALEAKERRITRCRTRIGAFTRWQREAELAGQVERVEHYARKIREEYVRMSEIMRERERERESVSVKAEREREVREELAKTSRRIGAFARWFYYYRRIAERKNKLRKVREIKENLERARKKMEDLKWRLETLRERLRKEPSLEALTKMLEEKQKLLSHYASRLEELKGEIERKAKQLKENDALLKEIEREIEEFAFIPPVIIRKYRKVKFEIHKSIQYSARKTGSDIDIEMLVEGTFKTLLPTRYEEDECVWLAEVEEVVRSAVCTIMDDCLEEYGLPIPAEADVRCNVVGCEIVGRETVDVSEEYAGMTPPITDAKVREYLSNELWTHSSIEITTFIYERSYRLGERKFRDTYVEAVISRCIEDRIESVLDEIIEWTLGEEAEETKRMLISRRGER